MYGVVKTHKDNNPMRPIISSVGSCTYNLAKWLVTLLTPIVGTISSSHIKNNTDLKFILENLHCEYDFELVSFDVQSLFTTVPIDQLLVFLGNELQRHVFPIDTDDLINLSKLCIENCKFRFNNVFFYLQKFGMTMGNPLSPVLSKLICSFLSVIY